jgi:hypothetical protein
MWLSPSYRSITVRFSLRGTVAALKAAATLRRLQLPMSEIERRRRGFVVIQIDALSYEDLHRAMEAGYMPHLKSVLESTHRVERWRSGIPSDTAAIQCALMYGSKPDIPGFYWLDRAAGKPVICSWPLDMVAVEQKNAGNRPGLFRHGSVYMGMASGGAQRAVFTTSALGKTAFPPKLTGIDVLALLVLHPYRLGRAVTLTVAEVFLGLFQTLAARARRRYVTREGIFPITRAITHVLFRELITLGIRLDIYRGVPAVYANFIGYDGVSHHLGPRSPEAYRTLKALDRQIRDIKRAIDTIALRPYDLYVMSDHGMTESRKFDHLYGQSLAQFIASHGVDPPRADELDTVPYQDMAAKQGMEELAADIDGRKSSITGFLADRAMRLAMRVGTGPLQAGLSDERDSPVLAIYSSALANVYFTRFSATPDLSEIEDAAPGLLESLRCHSGIGLVLAREGDRVVALHAGGVVDLESACPEVLQFLQHYDEPQILAPQLVALARMPSAGDLVVFGAYDGTMVVSFEDHAGSHGGLGGVQMYPFMVAPRDTADDFTRITDADQLHGLFARRYHIVTESRKRGAGSAPTAAAR